MKSRSLLIFICLYITLCVIGVSYVLYASYESHPSSFEEAMMLETVETKPHEVLRSLPDIPNRKSHSTETENGTLNKEKVTSEHKMYSDTELPPLPQTLPYRAYMKNRGDIQQASWTTQLYQYLKSLEYSISPHVNMVLGDSKHIELVLNWIIAAHVRLDPPLHNIMVISIDQPLCVFLASKKVPVTCITIPPESFLASTGNRSYEQGIKTRFLVLRLINFWGYDVASYDSDAVLLRNPQHFFDNNPDVQFFGGSVRSPRDVSNDWGFSVCGGALIVRSHPSTGIHSSLYTPL